MKALDSWARQFGYSDFDTYIQAGGSIDDVRRDIAKRIRNLQVALNALDFTAAEAAINMPPDAEPMAKTPPPEPPGNFHTDPDEPPNPQLVNPDKPYVWPEHVATAASDDEPPDPENAHIQGADG